MKYFSVVITVLVLYGPDISAFNLDSRLAGINAEYRLQIKPIFLKSCLNCHGVQKEFPWYHSIPGVKYMMDRDISEAHKTIDMSKDFPFIGKGTPEELLGAIGDVLEDGSMPPWRYKIMHLESNLTPLERDIVLKWIQRSTDILSVENKK